MSKQVNVYTDQGLLEIIYAGGIRPLDLVEDRELGEKVCSQKGVKKILVDCLEVHLPPNTIALYDHATRIANSPVLGRIKHALVVSDVIAKDARFLETASSNRGVIMRYFMTRHKALEWLNEAPNKTVVTTDLNRRN